jgi:cytochrome c-type biogenesis protein CcmH/NrfG
LWVFAAACALPAGPAWAADADGGTESVFSLGAGSRGIALGRAYVSLADDASAVYWNPAALRNVQSKQFMAMYMPVFGDFTGADYIFLGTVYPTLNAGSFGLGFQRIATTFDGYDEISIPTGEGDYSESQVLISYAFERRSKWIMGSLATGMSFKIVNQVVDPFSSTAPGIDLGFRWIPDAVPNLSIGMNLQDISGAEQKLDAASDVTYRTTLVGAGYVKTFANGSAVRLSLQMDLPERADSRFHAGAEYAFAKYVSIRAGFDDGSVSFGLGVGATKFGMDYGLDYAFLSRDEAGSSHPVSFTTKFGHTLDEQRQIIAEREAEEQRAAMQELFDARVAEHRDLAKQLTAEGDYSGALDEWQIVLEFVPDDAEAQAGVESARQQILVQQAAATRDAEKRAVIQTRFAQGLTFFEDNNYERARREWQAILEVDSAHAGALDYLARTQENIDEEVRNHIARAQQLERNERFTEAIGEWNNVQVYDSTNVQAKSSIRRIRGRIESQSRDYEAAQRRLQIVNLYNDALQLFNDGDYQTSITKLEQLLRLQADHEEAKNLLALAKRKTTPLTDEEKAEIRRLYLSGMQYFAKDEYAKAIAEWEKILKIDPTNESVQRNIDEAKERQRQLENRR